MSELIRIQEETKVQLDILKTRAEIRRIFGEKPSYDDVLRYLLLGEPKRDNDIPLKSQD